MKTNDRVFLKKGAVALPTVLILAAILLAVGLAMNISGNNKTAIITSKDRALTAFYIAETGIKDASEKIMRNKDYSTNYTLSFDKGTAEITIDSSVPNQATIKSKGTSENNIKTIEAVFDIDSSGKITKTSWREL